VRVFLLAAFLLSPGAAASAPARPAPKPPAPVIGDVEISASVSPPSVTIGDRVKYEASFRVPPSVRVAPSPTATLLIDWEMMAIDPPVVKALKDGRSEYLFRAVLVPWSATTTAVPALQFVAFDARGRSQVLTVAPVPIKVESVLAKAGKDADDLKPPKGVIGYRSLWPWIVAAVVIALAVLSILWWRRRRDRRAREIEMARGPAIPPADAARTALAELRASGLLEAGEAKAFYSALSDILRRYLEGRFLIPALDRTTSELLGELRRVTGLSRHFADLRWFLETADLVKFAKFAPTREDADANFARVRDFVEGTAPGGATAEGQKP
jgi:hypothetical protein